VVVTVVTYLGFLLHGIFMDGTRKAQKSTAWGDRYPLHPTSNNNCRFTVSQIEDLSEKHRSTCYFKQTNIYFKRTIFTSLYRKEKHKMTTPLNRIHSYSRTRELSDSPVYCNLTLQSGARPVVHKVVYTTINTNTYHRPSQNIELIHVHQHHGAWLGNAPY
jgi:hypothetical protein